MSTKKPFPVQFGESMSADLKEGEWTFDMPADFLFTGGKFAIVPNEAYQKMKALSEMVQYILDIDWLSTKEFCQKHGVPVPVFTGEVKSSADQLLQIDAVKHRLFVQKAKELDRANYSNIK